MPSSLLGWDVLVLNLYLALNLVIVTYLVFTLFRRKKVANAFFVPMVLFSIPAALGIHTVTAFLYNGLAGRPFWNASILAPRFIASAFCSGPAVLLVLMQILRKTTKFEIQDAAIWKVAELMAYAMFLNLFLLGAEIFKEYYSNTEHVVHMRYMFTGLKGHTAIVPWMWLSVFCSITAFVLFLVPRTRRHPVTLNLGCLLIFSAVYIEKGMGLVIPGMTPDTLGEIYEYWPTWTELGVTLGVFGIGGLVFTFLVKATIPILLGEHGHAGAHGSLSHRGRDLARAPRRGGALRRTRAFGLGRARPRHVPSVRAGRSGMKPKSDGRHPNSGAEVPAQVGDRTHSNRHGTAGGAGAGCANLALTCLRNGSVARGTRLRRRARYLRSGVGRIGCAASRGGSAPRRRDGATQRPPWQ